MGPTLCALAAGLLVGQTPEITTVDSSGWTQVQSSTQTRTWTQSGVWTPSTGWTWKNAVETGDANIANDKPGGNRTILSRFSERVSGLFGSRQPNASQPIARQNSNWSTGWHDEANASLPIIASRSSSGRITTEEPPLLEPVASTPQAVSPSQPSVEIKAASFTPPAQQDNTKIRPALLSKIGHAEDYSWIIGQIEIANDAHVVHYAASTSQDHFGGKMILHGDVDLSHVANGDLVAVHGSVIPGRMVSLYRVQAINVIDQSGK